MEQRTAVVFELDGWLSSLNRQSGGEIAQVPVRWCSVGVSVAEFAS